MTQLEQWRLGRITDVTQNGVGSGITDIRANRRAESIKQIAPQLFPKSIAPYSKLK